MAELCINNPQAPLQAYIDDTAQFTNGSHDEAIHIMYNSIVDFVSLTRHLQLPISIMGVIVSWFSGGAKLLAKEVAK